MLALSLSPLLHDALRVVDKLAAQLTVELLIAVAALLVACMTLYKSTLAPGKLAIQVAPSRDAFLWDGENWPGHPESQNRRGRVKPFTIELAIFNVGARALMLESIGPTPREAVTGSLTDSSGARQECEWVREFDSTGHESLVRGLPGGALSPPVTLQGGQAVRTQIHIKSLRGPTGSDPVIPKSNASRWEATLVFDVVYVQEPLGILGLFRSSQPLTHKTHRCSVPIEIKRTSQ